MVNYRKVATGKVVFIKQKKFLKTYDVTVPPLNQTITVDRVLLHPNSISMDSINITATYDRDTNFYFVEDVNYTYFTDPKGVKWFTGFEPTL